jgi:hypothetical protein
VQGTTVVTWTFNDGNGQSVTANQNVIIDDTVAPICITKDITITVSGSGSTAITTSDIDNGSTDNCGISTISLSQYTFTMSDIGIKTVTLTITDSKGNTSSASAQVTVENNLGVTDLKNNSFAIYPIPFDNHINIDLPNSYTENTVYVQLYDRNGKIIYNKKQLINNQTIRIDALDGYSDGGYFIYLLDENQNIIKTKQILKNSKQ